MYDAGRMRALRPVACLLLAAGLAAPAFCWTAATRVEMVDDAVKLMPPTLRSVLEKRRDDLRRGMLEPMIEEDALSHRPPSEGGSLPDSVDEAAHQLVLSTSTHVPFRDVARRFGELAHFVADAGFPPAASGASGVGRYADFAAFCESRRPRFPLVFYGHDSPTLARDDFKAFTRSIIDRAHAEDANLARAYAEAAGHDDPTAFDDRSVPFAVASLSYSRSVTDIVQAWLAAWRDCHGDLHGTPYAGAKR